MKTPIRLGERLNETQRNWLDWLLQTAYTAWRLFVRNELQNHAAATAFYFLLSAAPLVLLLTYASQLLNTLVETSMFAAMLQATLYDQFKLGELADLGLIPRNARLSAGSVGLLTLLLSSRGLVNAVQSAFRVIFPDDAKRPFVLNWVLPLIIIPVALCLIVMAVTTQALLTFLVHADLLGTGRSILLKGLSTALTLLGGWGLLYFTLRRLPLCRPPYRTTLIVSALAMLTVAVLFWGFGLFFRVEKYQSLYGALGGVVFLLIGAYLACMTFYFWAQFLYALGKVDVAALERLFLGGGAVSANRLEGVVFARANRLLAKYGRTFAAGETLITEGDATCDAFFLYSGQVGLFKAIDGTEKRLGQLEAGDLFGEMAHLLGEPRTATVRAEGDVTALVLPPEMLEELMRYSAPLSRRIIGTLCQRLQRMNLAQK